MTKEKTISLILRFPRKYGVLEEINKLNVEIEKLTYYINETESSKEKQELKEHRTPLIKLPDKYIGEIEYIEECRKGKCSRVNRVI